MPADWFGWLHHAGHWTAAPDCRAPSSVACAVLLRACASGIDHDDLIVCPVGQTPNGDDSPSLPATPEPGWVYRQRSGAILMRRKRA